MLVVIFEVLCLGLGFILEVGVILGFRKLFIRRSREKDKLCMSWFIGGF